MARNRVITFCWSCFAGCALAFAAIEVILWILG